MGDYLNIVFVILAGMLGLFGAVHALLRKRDPRSASAWIVVCLSFPVFGVLLYWLFGNNRIQTRARKLQREHHQRVRSFSNFDIVNRKPASSAGIEHFNNLVDLSASVSGEPLTDGNQIQPLFNGENAFPAMIEAINNAQSTVYLATYIFESRGVGYKIIKALAAAVERGVKVRVLIDGIGGWYSLSRASRLLKKKGVVVEHFLPPGLMPPSLHINLRNHRKLLVVDGRLAFTGGMNIRTKHLATTASWRSRILDVHFLLTGPVVAQFERVFIHDWLFCCEELLEPSVVTPASAAENTALCRVLIDGPNEDLDCLAWVLVGAIALAQRSIKIITPYFIPSRELTVALQTAALRGVEVNIIVPECNNLPFVKWASTHSLGALLHTGVNVLFFQGPFLHSKIFMVDDQYLQVGSYNLDPRSLRLNFEIAVEVYDQQFAGQMAAYFADTLAQCRPYSMADFQSRNLPARLRDAICWLFSPYL